eukprot:gene26363-31848_t
MITDLSVVVRSDEESAGETSNELEVVQIKPSPNLESDHSLPSVEQQMLTSLATVVNIGTIVVSTGLSLSSRQKIANMLFLRDGNVPNIRSSASALVATFLSSNSGTHLLLQHHHTLRMLVVEVHEDSVSASVCEVESDENHILTHTQPENSAPASILKDEHNSATSRANAKKSVSFNTAATDTDTSHPTQQHHVPSSPIVPPQTRARRASPGSRLRHDCHDRSLLCMVDIPEHTTSTNHHDVHQDERQEDHGQDQDRAQKGSDPCPLRISLQSLESSAFGYMHADIQVLQDWLSVLIHIHSIVQTTAHSTPEDHQLEKAHGQHANSEIVDYLNGVDVWNSLPTNTQRVCIHLLRVYREVTGEVSVYGYGEENDGKDKKKVTGEEEIPWADLLEHTEAYFYGCSSIHSRAELLHTSLCHFLGSHYTAYTSSSSGSNSSYSVLTQLLDAYGEQYVQVLVELQNSGMVTRLWIGPETSSRMAKGPRNSLHSVVSSLIQRTVESFHFHVALQNPTHYYLLGLPLGTFHCLCVHSCVGESYAREVGKHVESSLGPGKSSRNIGSGSTAGEERTYADVPYEAVVEAIQNADISMHIQRFYTLDKDAVFLGTHTLALWCVENEAKNILWLRKRPPPSKDNTQTYTPPSALGALCEQAYIHNKVFVVLDCTEDGSLYVNVPVISYIPASQMYSQPENTLFQTQKRSTSFHEQKAGEKSVTMYVQPHDEEVLQLRGGAHAHGPVEISRIASMALPAGCEKLLVEVTYAQGGYVHMHMHPLYPYETFRKVFFGGDEKEKQSNNGDVRGDVLVFVVVVGLFQPILNIFTNLLQKVAPGLHIPMLPQKLTTTAPTPYAKPTSVSVSGISPISCSSTLGGIHYNDAMSADIPKPGAMPERKPPPPPPLPELHPVWTNLLQKVTPGLHIPMLPQKPTTTVPTPYAKPTSVSVSGISPISCSSTLDGIHYNDAMPADIPKPGAMPERKTPPPPLPELHPATDSAPNVPIHHESTPDKDMRIFMPANGVQGFLLHLANFLRLGRRCERMKEVVVDWTKGVFGLWGRSESSS